MRALVGSVALASLLLLLQLAAASHVIYENLLETEAAAMEAVPPSIVDPLLRTGYHFQPVKNWINGNAVNLVTRDIGRRM
jgi:beta-fructofuranosidase